MTSNVLGIRLIKILPANVGAIVKDCVNSIMLTKRVHNHYNMFTVKDLLELEKCNVLFFIKL